jgi:hypothetical protein
MRSFACRSLQAMMHDAAGPTMAVDVEFGVCRKVECYNKNESCK